MLLILSFVGLIVIGIILEVLHRKVWKDSITFEILPAFLIGMGCLALICCTPIIIAEKTCNERHRLEWQTERDNLLARCSYDIPDDMLGHDIQEYNIKLRNAKYWNKSIWTNWLNEGVCQEFDEIRIEDIKGQ